MISSTTQLPELRELQRLAELAGPHMQQRVLCEAVVGERRFPVPAFVLGSARPDAPAVGFFGGVHGLERIGAEVAIAYLRSLVMRLPWDDTLHRQLETVRLVFMPLVNPGGLWLGTRANPNGVDLMRNAPVESNERVPYLIGGQRISAALPWYRGAHGAAMECESAALCALVESDLLSRPFSIAVDCHSGFGLSDRIWFPYAHTSRPIAHLAEMHALCQILDHTLVHHRYVLEPQSRQYRAHGDLWDHLYLAACRRPEPAVFLPVTLEMGSWLWIKKNPRQIFTRHGIFNPVIVHRQQRVLRSHIGWLDFITRAACSHQRWVPAGAQRESNTMRRRWRAGMAGLLREHLDPAARPDARARPPEHLSRPAAPAPARGRAGAGARPARQRPAEPGAQPGPHRDPRCSRRSAQQWCTEVAEHPTAGYDLPLDDAPWLAAQVSRWLAQLPRQP